MQDELADREPQFGLVGANIDEDFTTDAVRLGDTTDDQFHAVPSLPR